MPWRLVDCLLTGKTLQIPILVRIPFDPHVRLCRQLDQELGPRRRVSSFGQFQYPRQYLGALDKLVHEDGLLLLEFVWRERAPRSGALDYFLWTAPAGFGKEFELAALCVVGTFLFCEYTTHYRFVLRCAVGSCVPPVRGARASELSTFKGALHRVIDKYD